MKTTKLIFKLLLLTLVFVSCDDDTVNEVIDEKIPVITEVNASEYSSYADEILISAEGNGGDRDASVSVVSRDFSKSAKFIYDNTNSAKLGGLIQSIAFNEENAYIILPDVNTIVVADRYTFAKKAVITSGLGDPRYMTIVNGKGYVTNWGTGDYLNNIDDDFIVVIDLDTNKVIESISVAVGPEHIIAKDGKLYVSHKGGFGDNNIVSVIDIASQEVTEITVNDTPDELLFSSQGELVVLSEGDGISWGVTEWAEMTTSSITFINTATNTVSRELDFAENVYADQMTYADGVIYYFSNTNNLVYEISDDATELATEGIDVGEIYGMQVKENLLYTLSYSFSDFSKLTITDLDTKKALYQAEVGVGASKIYFNE